MGQNSNIPMEMTSAEPLDLGKAYMLAVLPAIFGVAGIHRFYMGETIKGVLFLCTFGFLGIGILHDLIVMPKLVRRFNLLHVQPPVQQIIIKEATRSTASDQVTRIRCEYCAGINDSTANSCQACGAGL